MVKKLFILLCLCVLCIGSAWGITIKNEAATSSTLINGGKYVIGTAYNGTFLTGSVSKSWGVHSSKADDAAIFTVTVDASGFIATCSEGTLTPAISKTFSAYDNATTSNLKLNSTNELCNKSNDSWKLRLNGTSGFRWYSTTTGSAVYLWEVQEDKTLTSIAVSGAPTKTSYFVGDTFDPAGLTVTGTYSKGDPEVITSGITWNVTPSGTLAAGTTSVSVTATVGDITSDPYTVNGLTVTSAASSILTAEPAEGGSYSVFVGDAPAVEVTTEAKQFTVIEGTLIQVEATTAEHFKFNKFTGSYADETEITFGANGASNKKKFTYGKANATITAEFLPMYAVNIDNNIQHGTVTANPVEATAKTAITLTLKPNTHYHFESVTVTDVNGDEIALSEGPTTTDGITTAKFKIPGAEGKLGAVSVTATFAEDTKYTVTFSVNGVETESEANYAGEPIEFPSVLPIGGMVFMGWTTETITGTQADAPDFVENVTYPANNDAIYYAVFAKQEGVASTDYSKITRMEALTDNSYVFAYDYNGGTQIVMQNEAKTGTQLNGANLSLTDSKYSNPEAKYIWQINKVVEEEQTYYTIYNAAVNKYVKGNSTGLTLADEPFNFIVAYDGTNNCFRFQSSTATTYYLHGYVSGSSYDFRSSTSGKGASYHVNLYKNESTTSFSDYTTFVGYTREVTSGNLGSICLPCDAEVEGATLYEISAITMDDVNTNYIKSISFSSVEGAEAGKGYVFKASDSKLIAYYSGSAVENVEANNGIIGNLSAEKKTVDETQYIISGNTVKRSDGSATVGQNRAYIDPAKFEAPESAKTADFTIDFDTPTAINEVFDKINAEGQWYSIKGEKVARPTTGVFVKNGVKYIFK